MKNTEIKHKAGKIYRKVYEKLDLLKGEKAINKDFQNSKEYTSEEEAIHAFNKQKKKFLNVNRWNEFSGPENASFSLYDKKGNQTQKQQIAVGDFIKIDLPRPSSDLLGATENISEQNNFAEVIVRPSYDPTKENKEETVHFFKSQAISMFRLWREGKSLFASENGRNESVNNKTEEAGNKAAVNTVVATGGWAGVQSHQWNTFTKNLVDVK